MKQIENKTRKSVFSGDSRLKERNGNIYLDLTALYNLVSIGSMFLFHYCCDLYPDVSISGTVTIYDYINIMIYLYWNSML